MEDSPGSATYLFPPVPPNLGKTCFCQNYFANKSKKKTKKSQGFGRMKHLCKCILNILQQIRGLPWWKLFDIYIYIYIWRCKYLAIIVARFATRSHGALCSRRLENTSWNRIPLKKNQVNSQLMRWEKPWMFRAKNGFVWYKFILGSFVFHRAESCEKPWDWVGGAGFQRWTVFRRTSVVQNRLDKVRVLTACYHHGTKRVLFFLVVKRVSFKIIHMWG